MYIRNVMILDIALELLYVYVFFNSKQRPRSDFRFSNETIVYNALARINQSTILSLHSMLWQKIKIHSKGQLNRIRYTIYRYLVDQDTKAKNQARRSFNEES